MVHCHRYIIHIQLLVRPQSPTYIIFILVASGCTIMSTIAVPSPVPSPAEDAEGIWKALQGKYACNCIVFSFQLYHILTDMVR